MINWNKTDNLVSMHYTCGYCGNSIASNKGYIGNSYDGVTTVIIYICHKCGCPTYFDHQNNQTPGALIGNQVMHIDDEGITNLFLEARKCFSYGAFTSSVMCSRKLLMNIAVSQGAKEGLSYLDYVNFLNDNNYIPPKGKKWVELIRRVGNDANHKIELKTELQAKKILIFIEMLLRFIYEIPGIMEEGAEELNDIM